MVLGLRCDPGSGGFARCSAQSWDEALLAHDVFGPVGDRTAYSWVSQKGGAHAGRPTKVPPAALSRAAATVHGLQARIVLSAAVIVCILQEELVKMGYDSTSLA